jgi:hypothetical protein
MISTGNKMLSNIQGIPVISVIYGLSLQLKKAKTPNFLLKKVRFLALL